MNRLLITSLLTLAVGTTSHAQDFDTYFTDQTLRLDYVMTGNTQNQMISLDEMMEWDGWAGRRNNLNELLLDGNADITITDATQGDTIYRASLSTLFQEWICTAKPNDDNRSFEATLLIPKPRGAAEAHVTLYDGERNVQCTATHHINPEDILIRTVNNTPKCKSIKLIDNGDPKDCIDIVVIAEGYHANDSGFFTEDALRLCYAIFDTEPFASNYGKFNVTAISSESVDGEVSVPRENLWCTTAINSNFDTFYSDRYLTTNSIHQLHDQVAGLPYEAIIILANTNTYGGGGIYNFYAITTAHHKMFKPVAVHEFGHSFAGLADEYFYDDDPLAPAAYSSRVEPWEPNITTLVDFESKWKDMLEEGTDIPTVVPEAEDDKYYKVGVYEGGGYSSKGVFRPVDECRMRTNTSPGFCPVCQRAIQDMINYLTK